MYYDSSHISVVRVEGSGRERASMRAIDDVSKYQVERAARFMTSASATFRNTANNCSELKQTLEFLSKYCLQVKTPQNAYFI